MPQKKGKGKAAVVTAKGASSNAVPVPATSRTVEELMRASAELELLNTTLDADIGQQTEEADAKKVIVDKLSTQLGKLCSLYDTLTKQQAIDAKENEKAMAESIEKQKANTREFEKLLPQISERIEATVKRGGELDADNTELREKLLAAADAYEQRNQRMKGDMERLEATKNSINQEKKEDEEEAAAAEEPLVVELDDETEAVTEAEAEAAAEGEKNTEEKKEDASKVTPTSTEEQLVDPSVTLAAEAAKAAFEKEIQQLYEEELALRKAILAKGDEVGQTRDSLQEANDKFSVLQAHLESTVQAIQDVEKKKGRQQERLLHLNAQLAAFPDIALAQMQVDKYGKLAEALQKAIATEETATSQ